MEEYFLVLRRRQTLWPAKWLEDRYIYTVTHAMQFELNELHMKLMRGVRQHKSDRANSYHLSCKIPVDIFFLLMDELLVGRSTDQVFSAVDDVIAIDFANEVGEMGSCLDLIFPPLTREKETDDQVHWFYGHSLKSRWYCQHFDLGTSEEEIRNSHGETLMWAGCQRVTSPIKMDYNMKTSRLRVMCQWEGVHKKGVDPAVGWTRGVLGKIVTW